MTEVDVLIAGAGPVGLTAAVELRRRGVGCRVIDRLASPMPYAKAVGIQPRRWSCGSRRACSPARSTPRPRCSDSSSSSTGSRSAAWR
ncbi:MAG: FAD-dependent monooxygenase [Pseudonocardia sp.]